MHQVQENQSDKYVGIWQYIPKNAFLYFPQGEQIKIGAGQAQWRKIFQGNQAYDKFQQEGLMKLQQKLVLSNIQTHAWFDNANKLRFLQANKWSKSKTSEAVAEYSRYRSSQFPLKQNHEVMAMLKKGTFYVCGRDHQYRPIIVADLTKVQQRQSDLIVPTLVYLMQFLINELFIQGQVENYVLIMNLSTVEFSHRQILSKTVKFTNNSYRGRLFVSYLMGTPWLIRKAWDGFASSLVSQNTLKKLKVTGDMNHKDMWAHIDKEIIQKKYGGTAQNITSYWPPITDKLIYQSSVPRNKLISVEDYNEKFSKMELEKRKVLKYLLRRKTVTMRDLNKSTIAQEEISPQIRSKKVLERIDRQSLTDATILVESTLFPEELKFIHTFFRGKKYEKIK